jgi:hypothetical protein
MHWMMEQIKSIDPSLAALSAYLFLLGGIGGWAVCQVTHKQRGIEVDRPLTDNIPVPPPPIIVPDHVPDDLLQEVKDGER